MEIPRVVLISNIRTWLQFSHENEHFSKGLSCKSWTNAILHDSCMGFKTLWGLTWRRVIKCQVLWNPWTSLMLIPLLTSSTTTLSVRLNTIQWVASRVGLNESITFICSTQNTFCHALQSQSPCRRFLLINPIFTTIETSRSRWNSKGILYFSASHRFFQPWSRKSKSMVQIHLVIWPAIHCSCGFLWNHMDNLQLDVMGTYRFLLNGPKTGKTRLA